MNFRILFLVLAASLTTACCSTGTTVVLVPDADGKVGQVEVKTQSGASVLSKANDSSAAKNLEQAPSQVVQLSEEKVIEMFSETLKQEPDAPLHFLFHFSSGSTDILPEDAEILTKTKAAVEARKSCDLSVIGHSDTVGDNNTNQGISTRRAETVAKALANLGIDQKCLEDIRFYGENDLAVHTADNVDEPQNRRVEVEIR